MTDPIEIKKEIVQFAYERSEHEHNELLETWKLLDTKAQATAGIAGVFVAAVFAFVRNTSLHLNTSEKWLLSLALLFLTASIFWAVLAMLIRSVPMPLSGADTAQSIFDISQMPESELAQRQVNLISDTVTQWAGVNAEIAKSVATKGKRVEFSQGTLVGASVIITAMTLYAIHCVH